MVRGELESSQQKPYLTDLSSRYDNDLVEIVWENGQIVMKGQSTRVDRSPTRNILPLNASRVCDAGVGHATNTQFGKFSGVDSVFNDMAPVVPSGDLDLSQDDEIVPWLRYQMDDAVVQDYVSGFLPEISGFTGNGMSVPSGFVSADKRSSGDKTFSNLHGGDNTVKASSSAEDRPLCSWAPHHQQTSNALGSGLTCNHRYAAFGSPAPGRDAVNGSTTVKMGKQNVRQRINTSKFLNLSHFAKPANGVKANVQNSNGIPVSGSSGVEWMDVLEKGSAPSVTNPVKSMLVEGINSTSEKNHHGSSAVVSNVNSRESVVNAVKESCPHERTENLCRETPVKNDKPQILIDADNSTKGLPDGERIVEPVVACSSVGSGNGADRGSCDQTHSSKRKFYDVEESECHSDDVETESVDVKRSTPVQGSKRSRAAEVHNLSERRRRDRINEKMLALQKLIPNCNKVEKASILDEAIEYLKTLQLQVQIMSMGAGLCMPPMMFPTGMQHVHPAYVPYFPPMGIGMGYGMNMLGMNSVSPCCPVFPIPPTPFPPVSTITNFMRIPCSNPPMFGHPGQGLPSLVPSAPFVPLTVHPPASVTSAMGLSSLRNGSSGEVAGTSTVLNPKDPVIAGNSQSMCNAEASCPMNGKSDQLQATNEGLDQPAAVQENEQGLDVRGAPAHTSTMETDIIKEPGYY